MNKSFGFGFSFKVIVEEQQKIKISHKKERDWGNGYYRKKIFSQSTVIT